MPGMNICTVQIFSLFGETLVSPKLFMQLQKLLSAAVCTSKTWLVNVYGRQTVERA